MAQRFQLWVAIIGFIFLGGMALLWFSLGVADLNDYRAGTPATATNVQCSHPRGTPADCTGTWSIGGKSYTGEIRGASEDASSLDVRVRNGTAYAGGAGDQEFVLAAIPAAFLVVLSAAMWRGRRQIRRQSAGRTEGVDGRGNRSNANA